MRHTTARKTDMMLNSNNSPRVSGIPPLLAYNKSLGSFITLTYLASGVISPCVINRAVARLDSEPKGY